MTAQIEFERLPLEIQEAVKRARAESSKLPDEALLGAALSWDPRLIRVLREWEREGRPSPAEKELKNQLGVLDRLRSNAIFLGAQLEELRRRAERVFPKPEPRSKPAGMSQKASPKSTETTETWTGPIRKSAEGDWRVSILENTIAELSALTDTLAPLQRKTLNEALNLLGRLAEELGGERSRRRLKALAAA